jgi:hypothetical protein
MRDLLFYCCACIPSRAGRVEQIYNKYYISVESVQMNVIPNTSHFGTPLEFAFNLDAAQLSSAQLRYRSKQVVRSDQAEVKIET